MLRTIETILRDHGVTATNKRAYQYTYETKTIDYPVKDVFPMPLDFYNANRDVLFVFKDGLYQSPRIDYIEEEGPVIRLLQPHTDHIFSFLSLKSAKVLTEAPDSTHIEPGSIRLKKLDIGILERLISPDEKARVEQQIFGIRKSLDDLSKDFAAAELRFALADRVRSGSLIGDNFKTSVMGIRPLEERVTIDAVLSGRSNVSVNSGEGVNGGLIPFRIGEEVTIFDNVGMQRKIISEVNGNVLTFSTPLSFDVKQGGVVCLSMGRREQVGYSFFDWYDPTLSTRYQVSAYDVRYEISDVRRFVIWVQTKNGSCSVNVFKKQIGQPEEQVPVAIKQVGEEMQAVLSQDDPATYIIRLTFSRANPAIMPNYVRLLGGYEV